MNRSHLIILGPIETICGRLCYNVPQCEPTMRTLCAWTTQQLHIKETLSELVGQNRGTHCENILTFPVQAFGRPENFAMGDKLIMGCSVFCVSISHLRNDLDSGTQILIHLPASPYRHCREENWNSANRLYRTSRRIVGDVLSRADLGHSTRLGICLS